MRRGIIVVAVGIPLAVLVWWISRNTYWAETKMPMPLKGEALRNPFYAAQRFADALGAHTTWDQVLPSPPPGAVIVLSGWHWDLSASRRNTLESWVESGGRLVLERTLDGEEEAFERWSGIRHGHSKTEESETGESDTGRPATDRHDPCRSFDEAHPKSETSSNPTDVRRYWLCNVDRDSFLTTDQPAEWTVRDASGIQAMRVQVGRGRVTVINAGPFQYLNLFDGDHGALFVAAAELRRGDEVHFLSEEEHPSLLALVWRYGRPVFILIVPLIAAWLWRSGVRFGPLAPQPHSARQSLAEQIRGTGRFAWRHGGAESLHRACVRALDETAQRRIPRYTRLAAPDRATAVGRLTGFDRQALAKAVHHPDSRRSHELRSTIALLEAARRRIIIRDPRATHGTE